MNTYDYLNLAPVEGKQAHLASDFLGTTMEKANDQNPTLRRKASVTDLKSKAYHDGPGSKFLILTPDPPKNVATKHTTVKGNSNEGAKHIEGSGETVASNPSKARSTSIDGHAMARIENSVDWVDYGFQLPPRQFHNTASVSTRSGSS